MHLLVNGGAVTTRTGYMGRIDSRFNHTWLWFLAMFLGLIELFRSYIYKGSQKEFPNNSHNKAALITELSKALQLRGVEIIHSPADADLNIALSAIATAKTTSGPIHVVSRDTDILVILLSRPSSEEVILIQPQPGK